MTLAIRSDFHPAISRTPVAPALDLEEFFAKGRWKSQGKLTEHHQLILKQGQRFLKLAIEGREIGLSAVNEGKLGVDLPAIKAYLLSYKAHKRSPDLRPLALDEVLTVTESVLGWFLSTKRNTEKKLSDTEVGIAHSFFHSLSKVPVKAEE